MNSTLSWSAWIPLARMSYATYLVHFPPLLFVCKTFGAGAYDCDASGEQL